MKHKTHIMCYKHIIVYFTGNKTWREEMDHVEMVRSTYPQIDDLLRGEETMSYMKRSVIFLFFDGTKSISILCRPSK